MGLFLGDLIAGGNFAFKNGYIMLCVAYFLSNMRSGGRHIYWGAYFFMKEYWSLWHIVMVRFILKLFGDLCRL